MEVVLKTSLPHLTTVKNFTSDNCASMLTVGYSDRRLATRC